MLIYYDAIIMEQGSCGVFCTGVAGVTMTQRFSRQQEQPVLEQGLCSVSMPFILAPGHLRSVLLPDYLLPQLQLPKVQ